MNGLNSVEMTNKYLQLQREEIGQLRLLALKNKGKKLEKILNQLADKKEKELYQNLPRIDS